MIARSHRPLHPGFLPFEFGLLEALEGHGLVDAHERCSPGVQAYSSIGRTGDGYRCVQAHAWLNAVWKVKAVDLDRELVTFARGRP